MVNDKREIRIFLDKMIIEKEHNFFYKFLANQQSKETRVAFQFIVRSYEVNTVTFESRKFADTFLCVNQYGTHPVCVKKIPPNSSQVQFVVRVQVYIYIHACSYIWLCAMIEWLRTGVV